MAKRKFPDISKFTEVGKWEKQEAQVAQWDDIDTCAFCGKGIKENERYHQLFELNGGYTLDPPMAACTKCALGAGMEW